MSGGVSKPSSKRERHSHARYAHRRCLRRHDPRSHHRCRPLGRGGRGRKGVALSRASKPPAAYGGPPGIQRTRGRRAKRASRLEPVGSTDLSTFSQNPNPGEHNRNHPRFSKPRCGPWFRAEPRKTRPRARRFQSHPASTAAPPKNQVWYSLSTAFLRRGLEPPCLRRAPFSILTPRV